MRQFFAAAVVTLIAVTVVGAHQYNTDRQRWLQSKESS
ncbi:hypothetical protein DFO66_103321 [Brevibacterium sanguinis]|uniref:Uncharacterized protein n=2 Tax=Brevibacterium TaxID=1696 RepID=A0A366IN66_9MICO|nr:hypothetical protein DFO66_103321 [Brevibacterium sanguinis]RBP73025.1 hypothetical protein DFO65_103320 [Brevibacterium celere]